MGWYEDAVSNNSFGDARGFAKTLFVGSASAGYKTAPGGENYDNPAPSVASLFRNGVVDTADRGTRIVCRKGHVEPAITTADFFSAIGTRKNVHIVGDVRDARLDVAAPSFSWTATAAQWILDTQGITMENLRLFLAGPHVGGTALTVTAPLLVSAAGCGFRRCKFFHGFDADQIATIGLTTAAGADDLTIEECEFHGETAAEVTTAIQFVAANGLKFNDNAVRVATAVAVGVVRFLTAASLGIQMYRNVLESKKAASETALTGMAGITGQVNDLHLAVLANAAAQLVIGGANSAILLPGSLQFGDRLFVTNAPAERAALMTPISA